MPDRCRRHSRGTLRTLEAVRRPAVRARVRLAVVCAAIMIGFLALASPDPAGAGAAPRALCPATPARFELLSLPAPSLERSKRLWVYLPPGYDCTAPRRYPVFYFNDGQD